MNDDPTDIQAQRNDRAEVTQARRITWTGFWVNALLGVAKIVGGILGRSSALVADGIHSFSDFLSDIIIIVMFGVSRKRPDRCHQFGHGKFETLATLILGIILVLAAIGIFVGGLQDVIKIAKGGTIPEAHPIALYIIVLSILSKEWLFHATLRVGKRINSQAIVANAWHHRTDSLSSLATLIGVGGAMALGPQWRVLDPIAAMVVAVFVAWVGVRSASPAVNELLDRSLSEAEQAEILEAVAATPGVKSFHDLRTLRSGKDCIVELQINVDPGLTVGQGHNISQDVERRIKEKLVPLNPIITIHIEPFVPHHHQVVPEQL